MPTLTGERNLTIADFSIGVFKAALLAGLLGLFSTGCGVKAPPVPPGVKPPTVAAFTHALENGSLTLSWVLSADGPTPQTLTLYRSQTALDDKPCPGCPLVFERLRTIPAGERVSGTTVLPVAAGYRYAFKLTATTANGLEGPDSTMIRFEY